MAVVAGEVVQDRVYVEDAFGDPSVLDAASVFSSAVVIRPDNSGITPTITLIGPTAPGVYGIEFPTDLALPGAYTAYLTASQTGQVYVGTFDVDPLGGAVSLVQAGVPSYTMGDFRAAVGAQLRDHMALTATADGSPTVFRDTRNLTDSPDAYRGSQGVFVSASGAGIAGSVIYVEASDTDGTLTFSPPVLNNTRAGDRLHLFNLAGGGFRLQFYDQAIMEAVEQAYDDYLVDFSAAGIGAYDVESGVAITIPDGFVAVYDLRIVEDDIEVRRIPQVRAGVGRHGEGWSVDRTLRAIRLEGEWRDIAEGQEYRIYGYGKHTTPTRSTDPITIDRTWLMLTVKAALASRRSTNSYWNNWAVEWGRQATDQKGRIYTPRQPGVQFL